MFQNATEYNPTGKEKILLEVLLNPKNRTRTITDICRIAECDRMTYYRAFEKPGFKELYKKKSKEYIDQNIGQVVAAFVNEAKRGSYNHGKVILEMSGLYTEKQKIEHSGSMKTNIKIDLSKYTVEELKNLEQLANKSTSWYRQYSQRAFGKNAIWILYRCMENTRACYAIYVELAHWIYMRISPSGRIRSGQKIAYKHAS